jgi:predicted ATPase
MENIKLSNFRKIKDSWELDLAPITFFTGTNNSGKSTIFKSMLLLEDFVKSNNHFQLDFNGPNSGRHKIDSYSNAINKFNRNDSILDIKFEYSNREHDISLVFKPLGFDDDNKINKGKLRQLKVIRPRDGSSLIVENTSADDYRLLLDIRFLEDVSDNDAVKNNEKIDELRNNLEEELNSKENELKDLKTFRNEIAHDKKRQHTQFLTEHGPIRLNKVLRKLNVSMDRAADFLESKGVEIEKSPNTKISREVYEVLYDEFQIDSTKRKKAVELNESKLNEKEKLRKQLEREIEEKQDTFKEALEKADLNGPKQVGRIDLDKELTELERIIIDLGQTISNLKKTLNALKAKEKSQSEPKKDRTIIMPEFSLNEFNGNFLNIDTIIRRVLPNYLMDNEKAFGKSDESVELKKSYEFGENILQVLQFSIDHLSPHRNTQSRLYINNNERSDINEQIKNHSLNPISKSSKAGKFLKNWMIKFDIGQDFKIKQIEGLATQIAIMADGQKFNLADKGFGAGQVFTILLKIALIIDLKEDLFRTIQKGIRRKGYEEFSHVILIEEPEANLHPALQSKLADLFYKTNQEFGISFILETHSEYILRRSQVIVKEVFKQLNPPNRLPFGVYYFNQETGPYKMEYRNDGVFKNDFGEGFFDVASRQSIELLKRKR